ncbi:MAG: ribosomal protein L7/L12 [Verrucomicrobia bacterium]|nr:ribosomal protein L7/L12 [Verrucomicrobiota bacterium]
MAQSLTQEQITAVTNAIFTGRKIEAIKLYREATNTSLVEAKEFVETLEAELRLQHPGSFPAARPSQPMPALVVIAVAVAIGIAVVLFLVFRAAP